MYLCIYWLAMSNSMYNPVIYCVMNQKFRRGFVRVFYFCSGRAPPPSAAANGTAGGAGTPGGPGGAGGMAGANSAGGSEYQVGQPCNVRKNGLFFPKKY